MSVTLTPLDIQKKSFKKGFRGYVKQEVDEFIEKVRVDYERLYKENAEMKELLEELKEKINHYRNIEDTLQNTLILAQQTAEEVKANAKKEKELIIREAEEQAKKILQSANLKVVDVNREYQEALKEFNIFKTRFITFLKAQLEMIEAGEWPEKINTEGGDQEHKNGE
ncbi:MAG: cell division initiation protein [Thermosediminibacterales bacterium]|jgi:cell division initiation protein|nr:cell division initiation protein [Thermosediminibacterales bacterium]